MSKNFFRKKEDFECLRCGLKVRGDGYTDHCPKCLWGRHMDEEVPGDRKSKCGGMMEPVGAEYAKGRFRIFYRCVKCGHKFWVREGKGDDREALAKLAEGWGGFGESGGARGKSGQ